MYKYSYSVPGSIVGDPEWQKAAVKSNLRRIELSYGADIAAGTVRILTIGEKYA